MRQSLLLHRARALLAEVPVVFFAVVIGVALTFRVAVGWARGSEAPEPTPPGHEAPHATRATSAATLTADPTATALTTPTTTAAARPAARPRRTHPRGAAPTGQ